jgi:energy-coupling factor transporter ATP-binding protein EcfA2
LSGGEQSRLVLACLLASNAKIILLDSPLSQLDLIGRDSFCDALKMLIAKKKPTIIVADQYIEYFEPFITRFIMLERGEVIEDIKENININEDLLRKCNLYYWQYSSILKHEKMRIDNDNPIAKLKEIYLISDGTHILNGINLDIYRSDCIVIMGENGSGKSTSMLILAGATKPTNGYVERRGNIRYVFQDASLQIIEKTVFDELIIGPKIANWDNDRINKFVDDQINWIGLNKYDETLDLNYSKIRMLAIADMNYDSDVIIFDEPTADIDSNAIGKFINLVNSLINSGGAAVVITHDKRIAQIASKIIVMKEGHIILETRDVDDALNAIKGTNNISI